MSASLLRENITTVEQTNFQKVENIVIYFLCNPSVTKQCDASDTTQTMPHWQDENTQQFAQSKNVILYQLFLFASIWQQAQASMYVRCLLC